MQFEGTRAREVGRKGGRARRKLSLERVTAELGQLDTLDDAMRWLRTIGLWAAAGFLHGAVASALVRSVEVWVRAHESRLTQEVVDQLRARLDGMERQLAARGRG